MFETYNSLCTLGLKLLFLRTLDYQKEGLGSHTHCLHGQTDHRNKQKDSLKSTDFETESLDNHVNGQSDRLES